MPQKHGPTMFGASPNDIYSDAGPGNSLDLDTDRPIFNDDTYRPDSKGDHYLINTIVSLLCCITSILHSHITFTKFDHKICLKTIV